MMPHIDEMLGVATVAAAALLASIAVDPVWSDRHETTAARDGTGVAAVRPAEAPSVRLPTVEVVGRRGAAPPRAASLTRAPLAADTRRPSV
jgi:hypothetical protein